MVMMALPHDGIPPQFSHKISRKINTGYSPETSYILLFDLTFSLFVLVFPFLIVSSHIYYYHISISDYRFCNTLHIFSMEYNIGDVVDDDAKKLLLFRY